MKAIDRFYEYLAEKSLKATAVEKEIGLSNGYLSVQKKRSADMGEGMMLKIIDYFRDINPVWLLTGKGSMLINEQPQSISTLTTQVDQPTSPVEESFIYKMYKEKDEENKALIRENGHLEERVRMLESKLSDCAKLDAIKAQELVLELPETARPAATKQHLSTSEPSVSYVGSPLQKQ